MLSFQKSLPELAGKQLALSFRPASDVDDAILETLLAENGGDELPSALNASAFNMVAEITIDGEVEVDSGSNVIGFGQQLISNKGFIDPRFGYRNTSSPITAGDYQAIGLNLQGITMAEGVRLKNALSGTGKVLEANSVDGLVSHDVTGAILQSGILTYFAINDVLNQLVSSANGLVHYRMPSFGTFSTLARVESFFGVPSVVYLGAVAMDVDWLMSNNEGRVNCWDDWVAFNKFTGQMASAYEHIVPEQIFSANGDDIELISTMKALSIANSNGQKIYKINGSNIDVLLPLVDAPSLIKNDITSAIYSGSEVIIHEKPIEYKGYVGSGYILLDPTTGSGAYKISGGANGAVTAIASMIFLMLTLFGIGAATAAFALTGAYVAATTLVIATIHVAVATYHAAALQALKAQGNATLANYTSACDSATKSMISALTTSIFAALGAFVSKVGAVAGVAISQTLVGVLAGSLSYGSACNGMWSDFKNN